MYGDAGAFRVSRSLRFNASDSAYLSRTPAVAGNRRTWTWSAWVKRSKLGVDEAFFEAKPAAGGWFALIFDSSDRINIGHLYGISYVWGTNAVFRDLSAWYHIVAVCDTTSATNTITGTATDRLRLYVNGTQQSLGVFGSPPPASPPAQNADLQVNDTVPHYIGRFSATTSYSNFYLANIHFIDGQALTPASFAETDATTGAWNPVAYTGSYGTNGFNLLFADNSSNTASTLGKDTSGNGNNWTPNNLSVTAGAGNDSLVDSPTNYGTDTGVGGEVRGNYATLNPLDTLSGATLSNGNLDLATPTSGYGTSRGTLAVSSGKFYWEILVNSVSSDVANSDPIIGIWSASKTLSANWTGGTADSYGYQAAGGNKTNNGSLTAYGASFTAGDVISVALNLDAGTLVFYKNGSSQGTAFSSLSGTFAPSAGDSGYSGSCSLTANFGQRAFAYTAPSGFKALCTQNLPAPLVTKSSTVFDVITYTGTGSSLTLPNGSSTPTSIAFTPDLVWLKGRSGATDHAIYDSVRDVQKDLVSNSTAAETTQTTGLTAFGTNTFTVGSLAKLNTSSATYVGWCWDAGTSTTTINANAYSAGVPSITSQVRANATAGFSVVTYTGNGTSGATVGHGLGVAPAFFVVKSRSRAGTQWVAYHKYISATPQNDYIFLNSTAAKGTATSVWNDTSPTSSVITLGLDQSTNDNTNTFVCYAFAPVVGYSSFGSYTGNGSADGPFVYTGFRPKWLLVKNATNGGSWVLHDTARSTYNVSGQELLPDLAGAEYTFTRFDILSNGFKGRTTNNASNTSSDTYIYAAFAEAPFNYSRAR